MRSVSTEASVETGVKERYINGPLSGRSFEISSVSGFASRKMERPFFSAMYLYHRAPFYQRREDRARVKGPIMLESHLAVF